jgi:ribosomal protein S18 acetylase RimI-like enzyme
MTREPAPPQSGYVVRPYVEADRDGCLAILRSNVPEHFTADDPSEFEAFLRALPGPYFVVEEHDGALVGCGGLAVGVKEPTAAALCWGIIRHDRQGRGLGRTLTLHRLRALPPTITLVRINTTQKVQGFYAKLGFVVTEVIPDGYAPGLDHVRMECTAW